MKSSSSVPSTLSYLVDPKGIELEYIEHYECGEDKAVFLVEVNGGIFKEPTEVIVKDFIMLEYDEEDLADPKLMSRSGVFEEIRNTVSVRHLSFCPKLIGYHYYTLKVQVNSEGDRSVTHPFTEDEYFPFEDIKEVQVIRVFIEYMKGTLNLARKLVLMRESHRKAYLESFISKFRICMAKIAKTTGKKYMDIHTGNILIVDKTDDVVVVDFGVLEDSLDPSDMPIRTFMRVMEVHPLVVKIPGLTSIKPVLW